MHCGIRGCQSLCDRRRLTRIGVEPSLDITLEAALTKLMILAAKHQDREALRAAFKLDLAGEQTPAELIR